MGRFVIFHLFAVIFLAGCGDRPVPPVSHYGTSSGEGSSGVHIVQRGETLYAIAGRYNLVQDDLALANNIRAPFLIKAGQRLRLPPPPTYRVRAGDSLSSIAQIFAVPTSKMIAVNNIPSPYQILVDEILKLPRVSASEASAGYSAVKLSSANAPGVAASKQDFVVPERKPAVSSKARPKAVKTSPPRRSSSKFLRPVEGKIISSYGEKPGGLHNDGVNIRAPKGAPVSAADNGVVVYAGSELKGAGNLVLVRHSERWMTAYAHLDKIKVKRGEVLKRGQKLGTVGQTGSVDSPQLHFEVRRGTAAINPKKYL